MSPTWRSGVSPASTATAAVGARFGISGFLLATMGAAIVAAPRTLPLMFLAVRQRPSTARRVLAGMVGGPTAAYWSNVSRSWPLISWLSR